MGTMTMLNALLGSLLAADSTVAMDGQHGAASVGLLSPIQIMLMSTSEGQQCYWCLPSYPCNTSSRLRYVLWLQFLSGGDHVGNRAVRK